MGQLVSTSDFIELLIYFAVFTGISIYSIFKTKKKTSNQNNDDIVTQKTTKNNTPMQTDWKSNRKNNYPYQISRSKSNNPIFGNSTTNINYIRIFIIFLAVAVIAVLLINIIDLLLNG